MYFWLISIGSRTKEEKRKTGSFPFDFFFLSFSTGFTKSVYWTRLKWFWFGVKSSSDCLNVHSISFSNRNNDSTINFSEIHIQKWNCRIFFILMCMLCESRPPNNNKKFSQRGMESIEHLNHVQLNRKSTFNDNFSLALKWFSRRMCDVRCVRRMTRCNIK